MMLKHISQASTWLTSWYKFNRYVIKNSNRYIQVHVHNPYLVMLPYSYVSLTESQPNLSTCTGVVYYCENAHLLRHSHRHTCALVIYCQMDSITFAMHCKAKHKINLRHNPAVLDIGDLILPCNLPEPSTSVCVRVNRSFLLGYSTYKVISKKNFVNVLFQSGHFTLLK